MDKKFFLSGNTADGFVSFHDNLIDAYSLKKLYILKGGSGVGKSTFIKNFAMAFKNSSKENCVDYFYCSGDPKSLDGAVITNLGIGVIDGTAPHAVDPKYPGVIDEIINLGDFIKTGKPETQKTEMKEKIDELNRQKRECYQKAYEFLNKAREHHAELEGLYKGCVDFEKTDALLKNILAKHL